MQNQFPEFSLEKAKTLIKEQQITDSKGKKLIIDDYSDVTKYVEEYFYALDTGDIAFREGKKFKVMDDVTAKKVYFKRMPKEVGIEFFSTNKKIYKQTCDPKAPAISELHINHFQGLKHEKQEYESFGEELKKKVNLFNSYVLEVLCSSNQEMFDYIMKWTANVVRGNKNDSLFYLNGNFP